MTLIHGHMVYTPKIFQTAKVSSFVFLAQVLCRMPFVMQPNLFSGLGTSTE